MLIITIMPCMYSNNYIYGLNWSIGHMAFPKQIIDAFASLLLFICFLMA